MIGPATQQVTANLAAIPKEKLGKKLLKTVVGLIFVPLGIWLVVIQARRESPSVTLILIGLAVIVVGATIWAGEIVMAPLKYVIALVKDVVGMARGTTEPTQPNRLTDDER